MKRSSLLLLGCILFGAHSLLWATPNFTKQGGILISSAIPQVVDTSTSPMRLYFLRDNQVLSSTSTDGITWSEESGVRLSTDTTPLLGISSITGCSLLPLDSGGYRMLYSVKTSPTQWSIFSATSADGLGWANDSGTRTTVTDGTFLGNPRLVELSNTNWRIYYLVDNNGGNDLTDRRIVTSLSTDEGFTWPTGASVLNETVAELGMAVRTDNKIRLFLTQPLTGSTTASTIVSALSDGSSSTSFSLESGLRLSTAATSGPLSFPTLFRSTESFRTRMLYGFQVAGSTHTHIFSALTLAPDVISLTPDEINRTDPNGAFTISGEIFGSTPTVALQKSGQSDIAGTAVTWNSDLSLTATFATNSQSLGTWDLSVTNPDGTETVLSSALTITFRSGEVSVTDNLMRLSEGTQAQIAVEIFNDGHVKVAIYTLDGKLVNVLYDGDATIGTTTYTWNGRTAEGNPVASGTYILKVDGPKLDNIQKIVVIR